MKRIIILASMLMLCLEVLAQGPSGNSQRITIATRPGNALATSNTSNHRTTEHHYDGFGREFCQADIGQSPSGRDLIQLTDFDVVGRKSIDYLPFADDIGSASTMHQGQALFYRTALRVAHTQTPFMKFIYDSNPNGELLEQSYSGQAWMLGSGNTTGHEFKTNGSNEVRRLLVDDAGLLVDAGYYLPYSLRAESSKSPQGRTMIQYYDSQGRLVMVSMATNTPSETQTYYVYDKFGRQRLVIPPKAVEILNEAASWSLSCLQEDLAFNSEYDDLDRRILQKTPGDAGKEFVYDRMNRIVMTQNGNQKAVNKWWITLFDHFDRIVCEGVLDDPQALDRTHWQNRIDSVQRLNPESISVKRLHGGASRYVFPNWFDSTSFTPLRILYYDDHQGFSSAIIDTLAMSSGRSSYMGMLTGTESAELDSQIVRWIAEAYYYDEDGNVIKHITSYGNNARMVSSSKFNLHGQAVATRKTWMFPTSYSPSSVDLEYVYDYDPAGRLKTTKLRFNGTERILASHTYNEIGQLTETNLGSVDEGITFLQSLDYSYNTRGWLTHINNASLRNDKELAIFSEESVTSEYLQSIVFDGITLRVEQESSTQDFDVELRDQKLLEFEEDQSNLVRLLSYDEQARESIYAEELDTVAKFQLESVKGETLSIDLNGLALADGLGAQTILDTAISLLAIELAYQGVTDPDLISELSNKLLKFIKGRMALAYHNDDSNDLWGMELFYDRPATGGAPQYDGLISQIDWKTRDTLEVGRRYGYYYDDLLRLTSADYYTQSIANQWVSSSSDYSVGPIGYDANGNLDHLKRNGLLAMSGNGTMTYGLLDDLIYSYDGNRLVKITDNASPCQSDVPGFKPPSTMPFGDHYDYDANGNMILDENKGIQVLYNIIDLPNRVDFLAMSHSFDFQYDVSGKMISQTENYGNQSFITEYYEDAVIRNGILTFIRHPFGRITWMNPSFRYDYDLCDHLGNVRLTITDLNDDQVADIIQENHYYPFGMEMGGLSAYYGLPTNPYQYNSKEKVGSGTLDWYDFGARFYDPIIGRWHSVDPLAESYFGISPYTFVANNPVLLIDPDGRSWKPTIMDGNQSGYEWVPETQSYDAEGNLLPGLYHQAIFFSDNHSFSEQSSYNMGSSTAVVYKADGSIESYDATTRPSDADVYATVPEGLYEARVGMHKSSYSALRVGDLGSTDFNDNRIELGMENPAYHDGRTYASGINIHKAGMNNKTGMTASGSPISAGCILVDRESWDGFIDNFNTEAQRNNTISVTLSRTYSTPSNFNFTSPTNNK